MVFKETTDCELSIYYINAHESQDKCLSREFRASRHVPISTGEIHLWLWEIDSLIMIQNELFLYLDEFERCQILKLYHKIDRERSMICKSIMRDILSRYLVIEPRKIKFCYNKYGKPFLYRNGNSNNLYFSLSHSNSMGLLGLSFNRNIGVDIEMRDVRYYPLWRGITDEFFHETERNWLKKHNDTEGYQQFLKLFTFKEALCKAKGEGLTGLEHTPDFIEEALQHNSNDRVFIYDNRTWQYTSLDLLKDYQGAVISEKK